MTPSSAYFILISIVSGIIIILTDISHFINPEKKGVRKIKPYGIVIIFFIALMIYCNIGLNSSDSNEKRISDSVNNHREMVSNNKLILLQSSLDNSNKALVK